MLDPRSHGRFIAPLWKQGLGSAIHCMAGDATGIIVAAVVTTMLGLPMGLDAVIEYVFGFAFGQSPFYEWLDNAAIRDLVHCSLGLSAGERLVLIKGLVPGLVEAMGLVDFDAFLEEVAIQARRFEEAVEHPGEGKAFRMTPGEELGGPTPAGHDHIALARDPDQRPCVRRLHRAQGLPL